MQAIKSYTPECVFSLVNDLSQEKFIYLSWEDWAFLTLEHYTLDIIHANEHEVLSIVSAEAEKSLESKHCKFVRANYKSEFTVTDSCYPCKADDWYTTHISALYVKAERLPYYFSSEEMIVNFCTGYSQPDGFAEAVRLPYYFVGGTMHVVVFDDGPKGFANAVNLN